MVELRCPVCGKVFDSQLSKTTPFCSERCRLIDLGRWLNEEHGLPVAEDGNDEQDAAHA